MSDSKPDWDALIPLLYKEFWSENEGIYILAGIKPNESETSFTSLRTGKRVPASEAKYLYKHIFDSWTGDSHPWTEGILYSASYTSWNDYNKYYYLHWVAQKPFIEVEWLDWAYSEGHLKEDEKRRIAKLIDGNVINVPIKRKPPIKQEPPIEEQQMGETARNNLLLVIGILKTALLDPKLKTLPFKDQETLRHWIEQNYVAEGPKLKNKGLAADTLKKLWKDVNPILRQYGIDPEPQKTDE